MPPPLEINDVRYVCFRHAKLFCQRVKGEFTTFIQGPNSSHLSLIKCGHRVPFAKSATSFFDHIARVSRWRTKPKVRWITTPWVVLARAIVTNVYAFRNRSIRHNPNRPVCENHSSVVPTLADLAVAVWHSVCKPWPALPWLTNVNLCPKALWEIGPKSLRSQILCGNLDHLSLVSPPELLARRAFSL